MAWTVPPRAEADLGIELQTARRQLSGDLLTDLSQTPSRQSGRALGENLEKELEHVRRLGTAEG